MTAHLTSNTIAALLNAALPANEANVAMRHLADCSECRQAFAMSAQAMDDPAIDDLDPESSWLDLNDAAEPVQHKRRTEKRGTVNQ